MIYYNDIMVRKEKKEKSKGREDKGWAGMGREGKGRYV